MKLSKILAPAALAACLLAMSAGAQAAERALPVPDTVSPELRQIIAADPGSGWNVHPKNSAEWKALVDDMARADEKALPALREHLGVSSAPGTIGGVPVFTLTPKNLPEANRDRVLLHLHGGGYVFGPGESGSQEGVMMAGIGGYRVIYVDYRLAPDFPFPAAIDDAMSVYRELLRTTPAERIGVLGTSPGGGMTRGLARRAREAGLPLPAALAAGTPWSDMSKTGDSYFANEGVDNLLVSYDGWLGDAARVYAGGRDLKDPMLSPVYGDVAGFPPTLLTSGTRDLFLSNTVRMHLKLREAGVSADLIVFEGMSHAQYGMLPDAPETRFHFTELARFFSRHLK